MCSCNYMLVAPTHAVTQSVMRTKLTQNSVQKWKIFFKLFDTTRLLLIIYLLIVPVSGGPFILPEKPSRLVQSSSVSTASLPLRHSHRDHPKVGIGIGSLVLNPKTQSFNFQISSSPIAKFQKDSIQNRNILSKQFPSIRAVKASLDQGVQTSSVQGVQLSSLLGVEISSTQGVQTSLLPGSRNQYKNTLEKLIKRVPFAVGLEPYTKTVPQSSHDTQPVRVNNPLRNLNKWRSQGRGTRPVSSLLSSQTSSHSVMDETESTRSDMAEADSASAGRERRATAETLSGAGRGEWMRPCPNLDSSVDKNATPQTLSTLILRAIHEAKSQVDKFINDFARETFHVDSWEESLPEHQGYSLPFLSNSSGVDLGTPKGIAFTQALQEAFELMQRRAVGIEQVTLDQALYQANFLTEFRQVEDRIVHVLCELRHAMIQSGAKPKQEVTKDVMEEESRDMDGERKRNIRDAVILREYIAGLQTLHALFSYYASNSQ